MDFDRNTRRDGRKLGAKMLSQKWTRISVPPSVYSRIVSLPYFHPILVLFPDNFLKTAHSLPYGIFQLSASFLPIPFFRNIPRSGTVGCWMFPSL